MSTDKTLADALTRFRCAGYDPTDGSGPIMVADPEGPWVLAADVIGTGSDCEATPAIPDAPESGGDWFGDVLGSIGTVIPLADVQPGGRVRLGDHDEKPPQELPELIVTRGNGIPLPDQAEGIEEFKRHCLRRIEAEYPHLSAQPSPGGQDALELLARFLQEPMHDLDMDHEISLRAARDAIAFALSTRQPEVK